MVRIERLGGHWLRTNENGLPSLLRLRIVGLAASMSATLGRAGIKHRSAACMAAVVAGVSTPGVSRIIKSKPLRCSAIRAAGNRLASTVATHLGFSRLTALEPVPGGGLGVEIDYVDLNAALLGGHRQGNGQAAFAGAALLGHERAKIHSR